MSFIRNPKDFYSGLLFIAFGVGAIVSAATTRQTGPDVVRYFPRCSAFC
jgi:hypothetical protein